MESMLEMLRHYHVGPEDEARLSRLAAVLKPEADRLAEEFYDYLSDDPYTAGFFPSDNAVRRRKETIKGWFGGLLSGLPDESALKRLRKIGKTHVRIGLDGHYVNAAMHFIRDFCRGALAAAVPDAAERTALETTLNKLLDLHLDVLTSSYREAELSKVFLSRKAESHLIRWTERLMHGLNLLLVIGLLAMAGAITALFVSDVVQAFSGSLERGVIKALGSVLILWMMIELLQAEIRYLKGGHFQVTVFLELALVAFIRKLFVASLEKTEPVNFALLLAGLLVLGLLFFLLSQWRRQRE